MRSWFRASGGCNGWVCVCGGVVGGVTAVEWVRVAMIDVVSEDQSCVALVVG